ncbi:hypothetical protein A3Q56_06179 [Intoshia linei]|uniref:Uncharacterized protein n=1 Tax=Intoshia linei TaxID=1819745 RepID=A0A177AVU1_9BILA|nr:hypothetical protein A3Q56_06179 [Intoshia linei]
MVLIKIGDKQQSFLNSKEWIGSNEISYVLNELLGKNNALIAESFILDQNLVKKRPQVLNDLSLFTVVGFIVNTALYNNSILWVLSFVSSNIEYSLDITP